MVRHGRSKGPLKNRRSNSFAFEFPTNVIPKACNDDNEFESVYTRLRRNTLGETTFPLDENRLFAKDEVKRNCKSLQNFTEQFGAECGTSAFDQREENVAEELISDPTDPEMAVRDQMQLTNSVRRDAKADFVPSFVLVDACKETNERKIRELVKRLSGINSTEVEPVVNFQDHTGRTALSYACGSGNVRIIEELTKLRRLDPNLPDNDGNTPLHYASQAGHSEAVDLMLTRFEGIVEPNCRNSTGLTPLMKAALQGRTRCCKSLIIAGANPYLQDYSRGLTAIEWARLCGRHICAEVIIRSAKDNYKYSGSPPQYKSPTHRTMPGSQSSMELKRVNSDDSPYYNFYQARSAVSGATWLKNKIRKALGAAGTNPSSISKSSSSGMSSRPRHDSSYALVSNLSGATICASSLLLPSIKPLLDQQQKSRSKKKLNIPTLQVTLVNKR